MLLTRLITLTVLGMAALVCSPAAGWGQQPKPLPPGAIARIQLPGPPRTATVLCCCSIGAMVATGSPDETVRLWDAVTGKELQRFQGHRGSINAVAFSPDGKTLASGSGDTYRLDEVAPLRLWDVTSGKETRLTSDNFRQEILSVAFSPNGRILASAGTSVVTGLRCDVIRLWDRTTGKELRRFGGLVRVRALAFSPDGKTLAADTYNINDGQEAIQLWEVDTGKERGKTVRKAGGLFYSLTFSPDGHTLAWSERKRRPLGDKGSPGVGRIVRFWDSRSGKMLPGLVGQQDDIGPVAFSPDGKTLLTGDTGGAVRLWEVATGRERRRFEGHKRGGVRCVAFSPGSRVVLSGSGDGIVMVWDVTARASSPLRGPRVELGAQP